MRNTEFIFQNGFFADYFTPDGSGEPTSYLYNYDDNLGLAVVSYFVKQEKKFEVIVLDADDDNWTIFNEYETYEEAFNTYKILKYLREKRFNI